MFTYKFYVNGGRDNMLTIRLVSNRKKTELATGLKIEPGELEDALKGESKDIRFEKMLMTWNLQIKSLMIELAERKETNKDVGEIRSIIQERIFGITKKKASSTRRAKGSFVTCYQKFTESKTNKGTRGVYEHTLSRIRAFDPDIDKKNFESLTFQWLTDFEAFCAKTACKNARNIHLRNIRTVFNHAIDNEITTVYPFRRFKIVPEKTRKRSLTLENIRRLFDYPVEPYAEIYRDMFKLIFMLIGINTADLHGLKDITPAGRIEYRRAKTHRPYSIRVEPEALELIEKYRGKSGLLCIADRWSDSRNFRHQCNKALQRIGEVERKGLGGKKIITPEFEGLTTYWARHSWATIAYELGISKDIIAQALGHSDGHDTTNIYIREDTKKVDEANRRVLDWVLYGKS